MMKAKEKEDVEPRYCGSDWFVVTSRKPSLPGKSLLSLSLSSEGGVVEHVAPYWLVRTMVVVGLM